MDIKKLVASLVGIATVIASAIGALKEYLPQWVSITAIIVGFILAVYPYVLDCYRYLADVITSRFTPDILYGNDKFASMTISARFRDNFNKATGIDLNGGYKKFCKEAAMCAQSIVDIFPDGKADEYCSQLNDLMSRYGLLGANKNLQYLFEHTPFIFAEHYYFYHILKLSKDADPWAKEKARSLGSIKSVAGESNRITRLINAYNSKDGLNRILNQSVFANSTDLSQQNSVVENAESCCDSEISDYIIDDKSKIQRYFNNSLKNKTIHIIVDNSGIELISDLILGAYLIKTGCANEVIYHHNILPIFVSDAIKADFDAAIAAIKEKDSPLGGYIETLFTVSGDENNKRMVLSANAFWNMPFPFKEMPDALLKQLNDDNVGLIIIKGDLNYRRLVEDKKWDITKNIDSHVGYFKSPLLILRSLKSNTLLGVDRAKLKSLSGLPENWKTTGDYGIIQFVKK